MQTNILNLLKKISTQEKTLNDKITTLNTTVENLKNEKATEKILDTTYTPYNISIKAYKNPKEKTVHIYIHCNQWGQTGIKTGDSGVNLATLPSNYAPLERIDYMLTTSGGNRFNIAIFPDGNIDISYFYNDIEANSWNQLNQNLIFVSK